MANSDCKIYPKGFCFKCGFNCVYVEIGNHDSCSTNKIVDEENNKDCNLRNKDVLRIKIKMDVIKVAKLFRHGELSRLCQTHRRYAKQSLCLKCTLTQIVIYQVMKNLLNKTKLTTK